MTCRERLKLEHPEKIDPQATGGCVHCPSTYDYLTEPAWCTAGEHDNVCTACWDREIPNTEPTPTSTVNHPSHYNREGGMECIDEMVLVFGRKAVMHFCLCNAWKYRYRASDKNGAEDLKKADWYLAKYKELLGGDES